MAVISDKARIVYFDVPKIACTSLKTLFWELDRPWGRVAFDSMTRLRRLLGQPRPDFSIHYIKGYSTESFAKAPSMPNGYSRVTVVRDPVARLRSAWSNKMHRAVFENRGEIEGLYAAGLSPDPDLAEFIANYETYRRLSGAARIHTKALSWHLGPDLKWFDEVFELESLQSFVDWVAERVGAPVELPRRNEGGPAGRSDRIGPAEAARLRLILASDYRLLGQRYEIEAGIDRVLSRPAWA